MQNDAYFKTFDLFATPVPVEDATHPQQVIYDQLTTEMINRDTSTAVLWKEVQANIQAKLQRAGTGLLSDPQPIPRLSQKALDQFITWLRPLTFQPDVQNQILAAVIFETRSAHTGPGQGLQSIHIQAEVARYAAWRMAGADNRTSVDEQASLAADLQKRGETILGEAEKRLQAFSLDVITAQQAQAQAMSGIAALKNAIPRIASEAEEKAQESLRQIGVLQSTIADASANLQAIQENIGTLSVQRLWQDRARESGRAFIISATILAMFLLFLPIFALLNFESVLLFLRRIGEATTGPLANDANMAQVTAAAISRLVVISVPLALYFWVIRLLVRFNLRSMLLMDDARQRHTMMDTYLHLIEERASTKEDRALVLNALFRPTPGLGGDNVDPPNFTELVDKAIGKSNG